MITALQIYLAIGTCWALFMGWRAILFAITLDIDWFDRPKDVQIGKRLLALRGDWHPAAHRILLYCLCTGALVETIVVWPLRVAKALRGKRP